MPQISTIVNISINLADWENDAEALLSQIDLISRLGITLRTRVARGMMTPERATRTLRYAIQTFAVLEFGDDDT